MQYSKQLFQRALQVIPGGVNSPVRAFRQVDSDPFFIKNGLGAYLYDVDDRRYIDYVCSWGPLIAGHAHPDICNKIHQTFSKGWSFGAPTEIEIELAEKISSLMPNLPMLRFVNSGTEAAMSAIRLSRGYTKRNKIIKFAGCYHGHADGLLVQAGSGALTFGVPDSAGVPASYAADTLVAEYNNLESVDTFFKRCGEEIASVIIEPVAGNMNCILPNHDFLPGLRRLCDQYQSLLIFDEVMTGFRVGLGGAQAYYGVKPDITVLGKVIGGGFPVGAFGGSKEIMQEIAPLGKVYQAGTLSGNPVAMAAGLATLELVTAPQFYETLATQTDTLVKGLEKLASKYGVPFIAHSIGGMFGFFFTEQKLIRNETEVKQSNLEHFKQFFHAMLQEGVYFAPSAFEAGFVSSAHTSHEIEKTLVAAENVFRTVKF